MNGLSSVADFMVSQPICAEWWHPVSFIRQQMLVNNFSYLPLLVHSTQQWHFISDSQLACALRKVDSNQERKSLMVKTVEELVLAGKLDLIPAHCVGMKTCIKNVIDDSKPEPILVLDDAKHLIGIITAFDLL